jgi:hypothetical protein
MKEEDSHNKKYIFIDECGDPEFYSNGKKLMIGTKGYQPLLLIGMIITDNRRKLWEEITKFQSNILTDPLYNTINSVKKAGWYLHAKDDFPDVRAKFFEKLRDTDNYETFVVIGRKELEIFNNKHNNNPSEFYFDVLHHLLKGKISDDDIEYELYLSQRKKSNMHRFEKAVEKGISGVNKNLKYNCHVVKSSVTSEMSIIDYLLWALQRYLIKGEDRFFKAVIKKYTEIIDIYDEKGETLYNNENVFDISKASKFNI